VFLEVNIINTLAQIFLIIKPQAIDIHLIMVTWPIIKNYGKKLNEKERTQKK